MIEEKRQSSVWNIAMFAVVLFLAAISFVGVFSEPKVATVPASITN